MHPTQGSDRPGEKPSRLAGFWGPALLVLAGGAAYARSFAGPFVFDDVGSIVDNPTIRHLWPLGPALAPPPGGLTVSGRPFLNLTLALNHAFGGTHVGGYHALNLVIHLLAGLALLGVARRTLRALPVLAWAIALLWTVDPLQTESVTYVIQRAESLMSLWYLLTLYCFIRHAETQAGSSDGKGRGPWSSLCVISCLLGMATKEVMVSAPLIALLYDRTFLSGSFRAAWLRRRPLYLALAATWILLLGLVIGEGGGRGGSAGLGAAVSGWAYWLTQPAAVARYLRLAVWPHPLVFEYGTFWVKAAGQVLPAAFLVGLLILGTAVALRRWPAWGFLGCWFFALLAPTSLVPGTTQMIVEHRVYLALAPMLAALLGAGTAAGRWLSRRAGIAEPAAAGWGALVLAAGMGILATDHRNQTYRSELVLWADTAAKRPGNALAHNNLGIALEKIPGRIPEAIAQFQEALRLDPNFYEAHNDLGNLWLKTPGRLPDAVAEYRAALRMWPGFAEAHNDLGDALWQMPDRRDEAISEYKAAMRIKPGYAGAHNNLGKAWLETPGKWQGAVNQFEEALRLQPDFAEAHNNLGNAWALQPGRLHDAIGQFQEALRLNPGFAEAHNNLGNAWLQVPGKLPEATRQLEEALRLQPDYPEALNNLGNAWLQTPGKLAEAIARYQAALRLRPDYAEAHYNLAVAWLQRPEHVADARIQLQAFLRLRPENEEARQLLASLPPAAP